MLAPYLLQYFRPGFHPWDTDERAALAERYGQELGVVAQQQNRQTEAGRMPAAANIGHADAASATPAVCG